MNRTLIFVTIFLLTLLLAACGGNGEVNSPTAVIVPPATALGDYGQAMTFSGMARSYYLHLPPGLKPEMPLVILLHGRGGSGLGASGYMGMNKVADAEGFIALYPDGTDHVSDSSFNAGWCCGWAQANAVDDAGYIAALIDEMSRRYQIDPKRVYASGLSNGAMLTYWLGVKLADRLAAIAPVAGSLRGDEAPPTQPLAVLILHGDADDNVRYAGVSNKADGYRYNSVADNAAYWSAAAHCQPTPQVEENEASIRQTYSGCAAGSAVTILTVKGGQHTWFGDDTAAKLVGNERGESLAWMIWGFFKAHPKQ